MSTSNMPDELYYTSEQIPIPPELPDVLLQFPKAAIRTRIAVQISKNKISNKTITKVKNLEQISPFSTLFSLTAPS